MSGKSVIEIARRTADDLAAGLLEQAARIGNSTIAPLFGDTQGALPITSPAPPPLIAAPAPGTAKKRTSPTAPSRVRRYERLKARAARKAGRDNRKFCELLDNEGVPSPIHWRVNSWQDAYARRDPKTKKYILRDAIRGEKFRALS